MKVRPFTKGDKDSFVKMVKYCFNMSQKDSEQYIQGAINFCRGFVAEENGAVSSAMFYYPFHQNIHDRKFKMAGISGVVTMPEARNRGMVREQFKVIQKDMVEQGYLTSCLEPFKPKYYQKFGWANASKRLRCRINVQDIEPAKEEFAFIRIDKPSPEHFTAIEKTFASHYNGSTYRNIHFWKAEIIHKWEEIKELFYYLIRHAGKDVAYVIYYLKRTKEEFEVNIQVRDYGFINYEGAKGLFSLFKIHRDQVKDVIISLPENFDVYHFAPCNLNAIGWKSYIMFKVINVKEAMLQYQIPKNITFEFELHVADPLAEDENLSFAFQIDEGKIKLIDKSANVLKCSIDSFLRMFIGRSSIYDLITYSEVEISEEIIKYIDRLFPRDIVFIKDMF